MRGAVLQLLRRPRAAHSVLGLARTQPQTRLACRALSSAAPEQPPAEEKHSFKAETSRLLDIVTNSIYTDKEIFLRELVSNAADALEKLRHLRVSGEENVADADSELAITLTTDAEAGTLTLRDNGVGMTRQEMLDNLGTIARSGSKAFADQLKTQPGASQAEAARNVIGQFGVGFYSAFMVGHTIEVTSRSALGGADAVAHLWRSTGSDDFTIAELPKDSFEGFGTQIVVKLKDDLKAQYTDAKKVKKIVQRYSNYVGFPVSVDGERANEISAIWTRDPKDVDSFDYAEFYRFVAKAFDKPTVTVHFKTDAPLDLKALVFVGESHQEKMSMERLRPGVSLYSRKVLLEANSERLLPNWMRFVKGVVDSDDLPISISRESMQDSRLLQNIGRAVARRIVKGFEKHAKDDPAAYDEKFFPEFGTFIKEGVCTDPQNFKLLGGLLRFPTSQTDAGKLTSLDAYLSRCKPEQEHIYYLSAPSRELALQSPYFEAFKRAGVEVVFLYNQIDDFVMSNLQEFNGRKLVAAESGDVDLSKLQQKKRTKDSEADAGKSDDKDKDKAAAAAADAAEAQRQAELPKEQADLLLAWIQEELKDDLRGAVASTRLRDSPAMVVDFESAALRRMMKMVQQGRDGSDAMASHVQKQQLEVNMGHPIVRALNELRETKPELARAVARQLLDNALVAAGLVDDPRVMLPRLNGLLASLLETGKKA